MKFFAITIYTIIISLYYFHANSQEIAKKAPTTTSEIQLSFAPILKKAIPAVVNIYATKKRQRNNQRRNSLFDDPFFQQFFGRRFFRKPEKEQNSLGSGVILSKSGLMITNDHVVKDADEIFVILSDKRQFSAKIILEDHKSDLAMLQIESDDDSLPFLALGNSDYLEVGDIVLAIGNPFGVGQTVTSGIISALARTSKGISDHQSFIQTDAAINPGNSGGALINAQSELIGVNTAIFSRSGGSNGIGFAVPSVMVKRLLKAARSGEKDIKRPWIGFHTQNITQEHREALGLSIPHGVIINHVYDNSPATKAHLQDGDIITHVDDQPIDDIANLRFRIGTKVIGEKVALRVYKNHESKRVTITLMSPVHYPKRNDYFVKERVPLQGISVINLSPFMIDELDIDFAYDGVMIYKIRTRSLAAQVGFETGDMIRKINDTPIRLVEDIKKFIQQHHSFYSVTIERHGKIFRVALR